MQTRDTSKLVEYTLALERQLKAVEAALDNERKEVSRLMELRRRDREIAAYYRSLVEGVADALHAD